jgi:hypothetical protein
LNLDISVLLFPSFNVYSLASQLPSLGRGVQQTERMLNMSPKPDKYDRPLPPSRSKRSAQTRDEVPTPIRGIAMNDEDGLTNASRSEVDDALRQQWAENQEVSLGID